MNPALTPESRVAVVRDVMSSDLAGEIVLLNLANGVYYGLDAVGAHVWQLLATPHLVAEVVDDVVANFDVERPQCEADVLAFLADLQAHDLLAVVAPGDG